MFNRLWVLLLILVCGLNALGVTGASHHAKKARDSVSTPSLTVAALPEVSDSSQMSASAIHLPADNRNDDCGTQHHSCHSCHLGHCSFLINSPSNLISPNLLEVIQSHFAFFYISIDLSGSKKPPRA